MVEVGTGSVGSRFINKDWPFSGGLVAGSTKHLTDQEDFDDEA